MQLLFQLHQELVDHAQDDVLVQRAEADGRVDAVTEFRREHALDVGHLVACLLGVGETDRGFLQAFRARIGGHDDDHVAEIGFAAIVVRQGAMVHHLQQDIENVRMGFFNFIEQQDRMRLLGDRFRQQATLVETNVARRRADQAADGVAFHVFRHVETDQLDAEDEGQLLGHLGLADTGRTGEQEGADRLVRLAQAGTRHLDGRRQRVDGGILPEHHVAQVAVDRLQLAAVVLVDRLRRNARDLGDDVLDLGLADGFLLLRLRQDALRRARFIDDVDRLVGQMAVVDEARRQFGRRRQGRSRVFHAVMFFEARLEAAQNLDGLLDRRLVDVHFLETAGERMVFFEHAAEFRVRGRADAFQLAIRQCRFQQVGGVQRAARRRAGTDDGVDLVDEQDAVRIVLQLLEHGFQALFEVTAVFGTGQQGAHVQRIHDGILQDFRHIALRDAIGQAFGDGRLAHARLADEQRIVLAAAAQDLDHAVDFFLAADQRVDLAFGSGLVQVLRELVERAFLRLALDRRVFHAFGGFRAFRRLVLAHAVRNEIDHIEARHALLVQVVDRMRILFAEDGHQHIGASDFLLAIRCGLDVHDGALDHALETKRRLGVDFARARHGRRVIADEIGEGLAQVLNIDRAGTQHLGSGGIVQQCQQ